MQIFVPCQQEIMRTWMQTTSQQPAITLAVTVVTAGFQYQLSVQEAHIALKVQNTGWSFCVQKVPIATRQDCGIVLSALPVNQEHTVEEKVCFIFHTLFTYKLMPIVFNYNTFTEKSFYFLGQFIWGISWYS